MLLSFLSPMVCRCARMEADSGDSPCYVTLRPCHRKSAAQRGRRRVRTHVTSVPVDDGVFFFATGDLVVNPLVSFLQPIAECHFRSSNPASCESVFSLF